MNGSFIREDIYKTNKWSFKNSKRDKGELRAQKFFNKST